jgi:hypothetical protein
MLVCSCSQGGGGTSSASVTAKRNDQARAKRTIPILTSSVIPPGQRLRGDGDADNPRDFDGNGDGDGSEDHDADYPVPQGYRLPDGDDGSTLAYGHAPSASERAAIERTVVRYYAAAAHGDYASACAALPSALARSLPETYAQPSKPSHGGGAGTCAAVLAKLFAPLREQLSEAISIVAVRVDGHTARAVFSSRKLRASYVSLLRRDGTWEVEELLGQALP